MSTLAERYYAVLSNIERAAKSAGKKPEDIQLVAVTKECELDTIQQAVTLGMKDLGENRAQQLQQRAQALQTGARWHFIGQLQSNKVKYIIDVVHLVHSLDRLSLASELDKQAKKHERNIDALIEINLTDIDGRGGVHGLEDCKRLIDGCQQLSNLNIKGIMSVAPYGVAQDETLRYFERVKHIFDTLSGYTGQRAQMQWLSMGMSEDYPLAIEQGANMVRVGSAIFRQ